MKVKVSPRPVEVQVKPKQAEPPAPAVVKKSFLGKCIDIIKEDWKMSRAEREALMKDTDAKWQDYKKFCELAKGHNGGKNGL